MKKNKRHFCPRTVEKMIAMLLTVIMMVSLDGCGNSTAKSNTGAVTKGNETAAADAENAGGVKLTDFKMGVLDTGGQDGTSIPLRNNYMAAIKSLGGTAVVAQPAGTTIDDYLDALDTLLNQNIDAVALPWVSFMYAGSPAAVKKCEDAGVYYGFYWGPGIQDLGEDTLSLCADSTLFLGAFYQQENTTAYNAMKTLHENGCNKLGYIGLAADNEMRENSRDYGIQQACKDFNMEILVEQRDNSVTMTAEGGATTVENFLAAYPDMQGIIIAGNTQFVMPGVDQAITSKGLTDFKVAAIDFPDDMLAYAEDGVLVYDAGAHVTGPVYITILAANALNGTPLLTKGQSFNQQYIMLTSTEEIKNWVSIQEEIVYNTEELRACLKVLNPDFSLETFNELVLNYSYNDIMKRHHD